MVGEFLAIISRRRQRAGLCQEEEAGRAKQQLSKEGPPSQESLTLSWHSGSQPLSLRGQEWILSELGFSSPTLRPKCRRLVAVAVAHFQVWGSLPTSALFSLGKDGTPGIYVSSMRSVKTNEKSPMHPTQNLRSAKPVSLKTLT